MGEAPFVYYARVGLRAHAGASYGVCREIRADGIGNGDYFDGSGGAQPFFIDMPGLYPGFAEAMTRMQEGGEYRFTMSQKLAFGNNPPPPEVPKGSNLTFEVRVQKIARGGAVVMMQQMQQMQAQQQQQQQAPSQ